MKNLYVSRDSEVPSWVRMLLCCHPSHRRLRHRAGNLHSVHVQNPPWGMVPMLPYAKTTPIVGDPVTRFKERTGPTLTKLKHTRNKSWSLIHAVEWTATWRCHESIYESVPCTLSWEDVGTLSQKRQSEIFQSASPVLCGSGNGILVQPTLQESEGVKLLLRIMWAEREKAKLLTNLQQWEVHQEINWIQDKPKWSLPVRRPEYF